MIVGRLEFIDTQSANSDKLCFAVGTSNSESLTRVASVIVLRDIFRDVVVFFPSLNVPCVAMNWTRNTLGSMLNFIYDGHVRTTVTNVMPFVHRR